MSVVEVAWAIRYGLWKTRRSRSAPTCITFTGCMVAPMINTAPFGLHIVYSFN